MRGRDWKWWGFFAGEPFVAEAEKRFFDEQVEEPAAEQGDRCADPKGKPGIVFDIELMEGLVGEVDELLVGKVDRIREGGDPARQAGRITIEKAGGAECYEDEGAIGDGDGGVAEDGASHFVLVIIVGDEPGSGDERQGDEQEAVAMTGQALPGRGLKVIEGAKDDAGEEAVEPGPCRIVNELVVGFAEAGLLGQDIKPHEAADGEAEQEEDGEDPSGFLAGAEGDDEQWQDKVELFFDTQREGGDGQI